MWTERWNWESGKRRESERKGGTTRTHLDRVILSSFHVWLIVSGVGFFPVQWVHSGCRVLLIVSVVGAVFSVQWVLCFLLLF